jgi:hypothetical protein
MKKSPFPAALLLLGVTLAGCPVYDSNDGDCFGDSECPYGSVCDGHTNSCVAEPADDSTVACHRPSDCGTNETCNRFGTCSTGDCHFSSTGCVRGYECIPDDGRWACVKLGASGSEGGNGGEPSAGAASVAGGDGGTSDGGTSDGGTGG